MFDVQAEIFGGGAAIYAHLLICLVAYLISNMAINAAEGICPKTNLTKKQFYVVFLT